MNKVIVRLHFITSASPIQNGGLSVTMVLFRGRGFGVRLLSLYENLQLSEDIQTYMCCVKAK